MAVSTTFIQDQGIYGKPERRGWKTCQSSNFAVFKDSANNWAIAQLPSGLSVSSLLPRWWRNTKKDLLEFVASMEAAEPEACEKMGEVTGTPIHVDLRPYAQRLINWSNTKR